MGDEGAKVALFASMSDTDSTFDFLRPGHGRGALRQALEAHGGSLPTTVHFVFDQFATSGAYPTSSGTITITRSRNIARLDRSQSLRS